MESNKSIYENLQWLVKKVKILFLNKKSVLNIGILPVGIIYTLYPALWNISGPNQGGQIMFPDPALYKGRCIDIFIPATGGAGITGVAASTYTPIDPGFGLPYSTLQPGILYTFYSIENKWVGGVRF